MPDIVIASGSVTLANMRLSAVALGAFVDFSLASVLTSKLNCLLTIADNAGKKISGYPKLAGTGETYSDEKATNPSFDDDTTGWTFTRGTGASSHPAGGGQVDDHLILTSDGTVGGPYGYQNTSTSEKALYILSMYLKSGTGGAKTGRVYISNASGNFPTATSTAAWVKTTGYQTRGASFTLYVASTLVTDTQTILFDEVSCKQVLTPSTTGVTIVSEKAGSVQSWKSQEAGFNYNDPLGYTYTITQEGVSSGLSGMSLGMGVS